MKKDVLSELITISELAKMLRISENTVKKIAKDPESGLDFIKVGASLRFSWDHINSFLAAQNKRGE